MMHETHKFNRVTYHGCVESHDFGPLHWLLFGFLAILAIVCIVFITRFSKKKLQAVREKTERDTLLYA